MISGPRREMAARGSPCPTRSVPTSTDGCAPPQRLDPSRPGQSRQKNIHMSLFCWGQARAHPDNQRPGETGRNMLRAGLCHLARSRLIRWPWRPLLPIIDHRGGHVIPIFIPRPRRTGRICRTHDRGAAHPPLLLAGEMSGRGDARGRGAVRRGSAGVRVCVSNAPMGRRALQSGGRWWWSTADCSKTGVRPLPAAVCVSPGGPAFCLEGGRGVVCEI